MTQIKETMSFYNNRKIMANKGQSKHIIEYDIISDSVNEDGSRTITIKSTDKSEHLKRVEELANEMVEKLGEGDNKLLRKMIFDTLRDYEDKNVIKMHRMVVLGEEPVKYREGCFKLVIGDGRKRNSHEIMLVE